jgi:hypothetical protein
MTDDIARLERCFTHFAEFCDGDSPLYTTLTRQVAEDRWLLELASAAQRKQPANNMLFAAVQFLLLGGVEHELRAYYPSVGGGRASDDVFPVFLDFCRTFDTEIVELIRTRRVQTNEVGRCGLLLPALALVWDHFDHHPLYLIDVGASAGLNLMLDRYRYEYNGEHTCGPDSSAVIRTSFKDGAACPVPGAIPEIGDRVGIDIAPADVTDDDQMRWIQSMIWADMLGRIELFRAAVSIARQSPPRMIAGDAIEILPGVVRSAPPEFVPCVYHSHAIYQMSEEWRAAFESMLAELGRDRPLAQISLEWLGDDPGPKLHLTICTGGDRHTTHLADCHHHGRWIRWVE